MVIHSSLGQDQWVENGLLLSRIAVSPQPQSRNSLTRVLCFFSPGRLVKLNHNKWTTRRSYRIVPLFNEDVKWIYHGAPEQEEDEFQLDYRILLDYVKQVFENIVISQVNCGKF